MYNLEGVRGEALQVEERFIIDNFDDRGAGDC